MTSDSLAVRRHIVGADTRSVPLLVQPQGSTDLSRLIAAEIGELKPLLTSHGALLFRGFDVHTLSDFDAVVASASPHRLDYTFRSTPRTSIGQRLYTATEYPATQEIPLHNENSYQREWPRYLMFCCLRPAASGGETPLADMRRVTAAVDERLLQKLTEQGVCYLRHFRPHVDLSWQDVFQTDDRQEVAAYCAAHSIEHQWLDAKTLQTRHTSQGTIRHPDTGELFLFNQAHLFHRSSIGAEGLAAMVKVFGADRLPRHCVLGRGTEFTEVEIESLRRAFADSAVTFEWCAGDVLLFDNIQVAHGRRSYLGTRSVAVAMLDSLTALTH